MNKVAFHTFGCKLNFSETSTIARIFKEKGYKTTTIKSKRDINVSENQISAIVEKLVLIRNEIIQ